jgi:pimeloyl-ACP methyl ester carboxylesterase
MIFSKLWHRHLRVPYTLHVYRQSTVPKPRATLVFLHGIGNSGRTWDEVTMQLPDDVNIVIVDLLGFGDSPRPDWAVYDAKTQARSLAKTLLSVGIRQKIILVGHSMGGLVAVEFAKRYTALVASLVLCSPPLYNVDPRDDKKLFVERDEALRRLYEFAVRKPENIVRLSRIAKRAGLLNPDFDVDALNVDTYIAALRANILNQTTTHDIIAINRPIHIIYGTLDPFVIGENIDRAQEASPYVTVTKFIGGHEIIGRYVKRVVSVINAQLNQGI